MGWRFRKSIKLLPGVKLNLNKKSTSISVGGKGIHKTFSSTGRKTTSVGIPGTGLYYTHTDSPNKNSSKISSTTTDTRTVQNATQSVQPRPQNSQNNGPWTQKTIWIILLMLIFFPAGCYFTWRHPTWKMQSKILLTAGGFMLFLPFLIVLPGFNIIITIVMFGLMYLWKKVNISKNLKIALTVFTIMLSFSFIGMLPEMDTTDNNKDNNTKVAIEKTNKPEQTESPEAEVVPAVVPAAIPEETVTPMEAPTPEPTVAPTTEPSQAPTPVPTVTPTQAPTVAPVVTETPAEPSKTIVYITDTGTKYHTAYCRHLNDSKREIELEDAKAQGYKPCSVCGASALQ